MKKQVVKKVTRSTFPRCESTIARNVSNKHCFKLQSDEIDLSETSDNVNVTFIDGQVGEQISAPASQNHVANVDGTQDLSLGRFLARPTLLYSNTWSTSDAIGSLTITNPWKDFINDPVVKRKLENYAFIRGKLHIKVVINATPFQFGCLRVTYIPMSGNLTLKTRGSAVSSLVPRSQIPGFYIWPAQNSGGEMELPFLYHQNWLDITSNTDVTNFGTLNYYIYAPLDVAITGGPTSLTVKTLAWMTDVELMGSTAKLTLQSDEYGVGPVSAPATAVANAASYLTKIPIIGPFARATEIGASAISKIASLFGYTNPPNINNVNAFYPMTGPQLATAEISVPYQKLSLDPKTELSIDPSPYCVEGHDQLSLPYLKSRESYFGSCTWSSSSPVGSLLFTSRVTPDLKISEDITNASAAVVGRRADMVPLSYIGALFKHWRGSIKFRFKVVCTKYHKGRLKIQFDPLSDISVTNVGTNVVYTHILDLGETDELIVEVPYHQALAWCNVETTPNSNNWSTSSLAPRLGIDNGIISVRVFNELESPLALSTINILCFVSGGDDFEFANPASNVTSTSTALYPSLMTLQSGEYDIHEETFGTKPIPHPERYGQNYGENILSLRKLLRRSCVVDTVPLPTGTTNAFNIYRKSYMRMPYMPGFYPTLTLPTTATRVVAASGTTSFAFNSMHPLPWITGMFVGFRGSTNYAVTVNSPDITPDDIRFIRCTDSGGGTPARRIIQLAASIPGTQTLSQKISALDIDWNQRNGLAGYAITSASANPTALFTFPDYNNYNFSLANPINYIDGDSRDGTNVQSVVLSLTTANTSSTDKTGYTTITSSVGAGADFTCVYFLCCPTVDWCNTIPTATP